MLVATKNNNRATKFISSLWEILFKNWWWFLTKIVDEVMQNSARNLFFICHAERLWPFSINKHFIYLENVRTIIWCYSFESCSKAILIWHQDVWNKHKIQTSTYYRSSSNQEVYLKLKMHAYIILPKCNWKKYIVKQGDDETLTK